MNGAPLRGDDIVSSSDAATRQQLDVILDRAGAVAGTLMDHQTGRVTATRIAEDVSPLFVGPFTADVINGRFALRGLPPGDYIVRLEGRSGLRRVRVEAGEMINLTF